MSQKINRHKNNDLAPLGGSDAIKKRVLDNCRREGKFAFPPTAMAVAFLRASI